MPYATEDHPWGVMQWIMSPEECKQSGLTVATMEIAPFAKCGCHLHDNAMEIFRCDAGEILLSFNEQTIILGPGDHHIIPDNVPHEIINKGSDIAQATIIYTSPNRHYTAIENTK